MSQDGVNPLFNTMAVIGVGLIGGSLGMAAKRSNLAGRVVGYGRNRANLEDAVNLGAIDTIADSAGECVVDADIVFVCTPVRTVAHSLREIAGNLKEDAIITDVGSTKRTIVELAAEILPERVFFIGGHPMAGTEKSGAKYAFPELFQSATYVLTPGPETNLQALSKLSSFVDGIGACCEVMDPIAHDKSVAAISHLPHIIASSLLEVAQHSDRDTGKSFRLAAGSFRDLTRIADSPPEIWRDICLTNADLICEEIDVLSHWLDRFKSALAANDEQELMTLFEQGKQIRQMHLRK